MDNRKIHQLWKLSNASMRDSYLRLLDDPTSRLVGDDEIRLAPPKTLLCGSRLFGLFDYWVCLVDWMSKSATEIMDGLLL